LGVKYLVILGVLFLKWVVFRLLPSGVDIWHWKAGS
jgi:hypothetical protein